jgi:hypothetical protein
LKTSGLISIQKIIFSPTLLTAPESATSGQGFGPTFSFIPVLAIDIRHTIAARFFTPEKMLSLISPLAITLSASIPSMIPATYGFRFTSTTPGINLEA